MKNRIKFFIILYLFTFISKLGLTEDTKVSETNLENGNNSKNSKDDPTEESVIIKDSKDNKVTEPRSKTTVKKQNTDGDEPNIIGGFNAQLGWYPYQVAIFTADRGTGSFYCGGSIISNYYVLTAGHCAVHRNQVRVVAGILKSNEIYVNTAQVRLSRYIIIHEKYDHESGDSVNDIAMIILEKPFYFNNFVKPIYLATTPPIVGSQCVISGWGYINPAHSRLQSTLKALFVTIREPRICKRWYDKWMDGMICTGFIRGQDFCFGDSGGPLVCDHVQHGVVSYFLAESGDFCASGGPNVYAKVYYYRPWIDYHMNAFSYRNDSGTTVTTKKSKSNLIRPKLFIISAFILLSMPFK